jgi:hypothetical protein
LLEAKWKETDPLEEQTEVVELAFMCVVAFILAPRGNEIMIVHFGGIIQYLDESTQDPAIPHVLITLNGTRFKGDMIDWCSHGRHIGIRDHTRQIVDLQIG